MLLRIVALAFVLLAVPACRPSEARVEPTPTFEATSRPAGGAAPSGARPNAYDRRIAPPGGGVMCMYDLDVREVHDAAAARRVVDELNARVAMGRKQEPSAAHYVNVIGRRGSGPDPEIDKEVRAVLFPDGIVEADSVAVEAR